MVLKTKAFLIAAIVMLVNAAGSRAEDVSAKQMQIKDDANPSKQQLKYQSQDAGISFSDGYASVGAISHTVSLTITSQTTSNTTFLTISPGDCETKGETKVCKSADGTRKVQIKPGKIKAQFKGNTGYELDALANQLPLMMVLHSDAADYCSICGNGGTDQVKEDGSDGKKLLVKACEPVACPPQPKGCCDGNRCLGGLTRAECTVPFSDDFHPDEVCDASMHCVPPPGTRGACCDISGLCESVSEAACTSSSGDYSGATVCEPSGACAPLPSCPTLGNPCGSCGSGLCLMHDSALACADSTTVTGTCSSDADCPPDKACVSAGFGGQCATPCP